jgi:hypothetical protein
MPVMVIRRHAGFCSRSSSSSRSAVRPKKGVTAAVNDAGAVYPITIDPLLQQAYLKAALQDLPDQPLDVVPLA